jgi:hypothetical protein
MAKELKIVISDEDYAELLEDSNFQEFLANPFEEEDEMGKITTIKQSAKGITFKVSDFGKFLELVQG